MNKKIVYIVLGIVVILGFCFYWFQLRPNQIRKECSGGNLTYLGRLAKGITDKDYINCLRQNGLEK